MITIKDLGKTYQHRTATVEALKHINLTVGANEIFGVMGKSGSGKSTFNRDRLSNQIAYFNKS